MVCKESGHGVAKRQRAGLALSPSSKDCRQVLVCKHFVERQRAWSNDHYVGAVLEVVRLDACFILSSQDSEFCLRGEHFVANTNIAKNGFSGVERGIQLIANALPANWRFIGCE